MMPERADNLVPSKVSQAALDLESAVQGGDATIDGPHTHAEHGTRDWEGKRLGKYHVTSILGKGAVGVVFKAHDPTIERDVAIKVLADHLAADANALGRFLSEARAAGKLNHANVMAIYEIGQEGPFSFLVLEYIAGGSLNDCRAGDKSLSVFEVTQALVDACKGVGAAHAVGLIHRDIKPANLMRAADGSIKVADFGLAKTTADTSHHLTQTGVLVGTPYFMSPEQCQAKTLDHRSDIYSLGATYYTLLTGQHPYLDSESVVQLMYLHCHGPIPDPRSIDPSLPEACSRIVAKAMAKSPKERYQSTGEMAADLQHLMAMISGQTPASPAMTGPLPGSSTQFKASTLSSSGHRTREAERRQVAVLVCGCRLFESTAYLELDSEDQAKLVRAFQQTCENAVHQFDGTIVQCNEQGLLACFGFPIAFEDGSHRAVRTGLAMLENLQTLVEPFQRELRLKLDPWASVHTGLAVVSGGKEAVSLVGEARNVAVRLQDIAELGRVICTETTYRIVRRQFRCIGLGSRKIKDMAQPMELFRIERPIEGANADHVERQSGLSPLIGRDLEVNLLKDRWEQVKEGMGQIVLLIGEAGLGKSRLVATLKQHVFAEMTENHADVSLLEWRCAPHFQNTALHPLIDFLERAIGLKRDEPVQIRFDQMHAYLEKHDLTRLETVPLWASLLSLPAPDHFPVTSLSPVRKREETFRMLVEWLHARGVEKPVLFVVEDLHWADPSTLEFLNQFFAAGLYGRIMTLLTFRPEFKPPWFTLSHQTSLVLNRLTRRQVGDMMRSESKNTLPEELVEQIYNRAGGVPLFVEEFTKMLNDTGDRQRMDASGTLAPRVIPSTLQDLLTARLDRLDGDRDIAQLAAALGREFSYELLAAAVTVDETTLQSELNKLMQAEIVYPKGRPPKCAYFFKHALLEDALYNGMVKSKRQQFHRRIAEVMEARFPQIVESHPELLAHHYGEAGEADMAVGYWLKAGLRSRQRSADCEAIGHLTKGCALLDTIPETPKRNEQKLQFLTALGPAHIAVHGYAAPEVGPILQRARDMCQQIGDQPQLFGIMLGKWEWHIVRGDLRICADLAAEGMVFAERLNDPGIMMEALFMPGVTKFYRAQFAGARENHETALTYYDDRERTKFWTSYSNHDSGVTHRCYLVLDLWHLGFADQALRLNRATCELARSIKHPFSLAHAVDFSACLHYFCRLGPEMQAAAEEEIAIGKDQGFQLWRALGTLHKGAAMLLQGQPEESLHLLLQGLQMFRDTGAEVRVPYYLSMIGDAYTRCRKFDEAHKVLNEGLAIAEKNDDRFQDAELLRLKGELIRVEAPGQTAIAEEYFRKAIGTARRQGSKACELRASMSLARLWQNLDHHDEARAALSSVYAAFTEGFTTPDLSEAKVLLE